VFVILRWVYLWWLSFPFFWLLSLSLRNLDPLILSSFWQMIWWVLHLLIKSNHTHDLVISLFWWVQCLHGCIDNTRDFFITVSSFWLMNWWVSCLLVCYVLSSFSDIA
jgi:hypothetical protein